MSKKTLQESLGLDKDAKLIDVKISVGDHKTEPGELIEQMAKVIESDRNGLLTEYSDY